MTRDKASSRAAGRCSTIRQPCTIGAEQTRGKRPNRPAPRDRRARDVQLSQFYTRDEVAARFYGVFRAHFDDALFRMVEPSAGEGAFLRLMPDGSIGYDLEPRCSGVETADFLGVRLDPSLKVAVLGNPPFGRNSSTAVRFFNHAAAQAEVIAFILPRTFRKASIQNRLDRHFHLLHEEDVPADAFVFRGRLYHVPTVFQIWVRRPEKRDLRPTETSHPHFDFTTPERADFAIQRVGARAGRLHRGFGKSRSSHYFIRCSRAGVRRAMSRLDLAAAAADSAGNPSLSKAEIVGLYRAETETRSAAHATARLRKPAPAVAWHIGRPAGRGEAPLRTLHATGCLSILHRDGDRRALCHRRAVPRAPPASCRRTGLRQRRLDPCAHARRA